MASNFGRASTSANSESSSGLLINVNTPLRTCSKSAKGGPRQSKPANSTFVSKTARIPLTAHAALAVLNASRHASDLPALLSPQH
jgi:hypothetical protein